MRDPRFSPVLPVSGSLLAAPPFPRPGPSESGSPTSKVILRCYDFPPTHSRSLIWFASESHTIPPLFVLALRRSRAGRGPTSRPEILLGRLARRVDVSGSSQVPRRPILCLCSGLGPRPNRRSLAMTVSSMLPLLFRRQRLQRLTYRGYRGALAPAVYASWGMLPLPMQDSLPAGWLAFAGRELNPLDRDERFPSCYISSPLPGFILTLRNPSH